MKTKSIPAFIMLLAGAIACIAGIASHLDVAGFVKMLLIVLIVFYFLGCIVKIILDSSCKEEDKETTDGETASEDEEAGEDAAAENIDADRENGQKDE